MLKNKSKLEKASYQELAEELGVTVSTVSKYPKIKRDLMLLGLKARQNYSKSKK